MTGTTFTPGIGRLAADDYEFHSHVDGYSDRHNSSDIDVSPPVVVNAISYSTVSTALAAIVGEVAGNFIAAGDLSGNASSQTVIGIQTIPVSSITPSLNNVLLFTGGHWVPSPIPSAPLTGSAGGDLGGTYPNPSVVQVHGATVPTIGTTGNTLYVSGGSSLSYGALNLAGGSNYVTGTLPSGNQAAQTMGGDISGTTASSTVIGIRGVTVSSMAPTSNQVLQYNGSVWIPATLSITTLAGDVTGSAGTNTVVSLTGSAGSVVAKASLVPFTDNTYVLGGTSFCWANAYIGNSVVWPSTYIPVAIGNLGMDLTASSGRPHALIDGYDHGLSAWRAYFGDGSDGEEVCNGSLAVNGMSLVGDVYTLQRDCYFTNLTISSSADVLLDGYRLFVNGLLTIGSGCSIGVPGNNATNGTPGAATTIGTVLGGSAGGTGSTGAGGNGVSETNAFGGSGGHGGAGGGSDGTGGVATVPTVNLGSIRHAPEALLGAIYAGGGSGWTPISGGCGGGGGIGGTGTTGGGGGSGGGIAIIATRVITGTGSISVVGGNGGNSSTISANLGDGGGGGGGGLVILVYGDKSGYTGSVLVSGGVGGTGINSGATGAAGSIGTVIEIPA